MDISVTVCFFVICLFIQLWISPSRIQLASSNFARLFIGVLGRESSPVAGPITLFGPLTIVSLLFSIVLSFSMKFSPGGRSPPAWLFQNPRWPPKWPPRTYKSMIIHNVRSKYCIIALLVLIIMFLTTWNLIITLT